MDNNHYDVTNPSTEELQVRHNCETMPMHRMKAVENEEETEDVLTDISLMKAPRHTHISNSEIARMLGQRLFLRPFPGRIECMRLRHLNAAHRKPDVESQ